MPLHVSIVVSFRTGPLLSEIQIFLWIFFVKIAHSAGISNIHMESSSINIFWGLFVFIDSFWIIRFIKVVVVCNDLSIYFSCSKSRSKIIFDKLSLGLSCKIHARIVSRIQRLILRCNSPNLNSFTLHCFDVLYKIQSIRFIVLRL